ncbi:claudin-18 [Brienomyrus brachyistius]|uniref:claudin-18 n=1 Tax=Brienomyrus brachyistius TaxID=42636 RepID=UPI0020B31B24|nr:claudin-18 [Brienomyrus brachyistius]
MASTMIQTSGFILGLLGVIAVIAATGMNNWSSQDREGDVVTSVYTYKGLWQTCVVETSGFTECRAFYTILGLPGTFQAVRALMIVGIVLGAIGVLISICSLKCIRMGTMEDGVKANMTLTAGIMFIVAGICGISGASVYANQIVSSFMMSTYNPQMGGMGGMGGMEGMGMGGNLAPRYTFGPALFVAWVGGAVLLLGGVLKCLAFKGLMPEKSRYNAVAYKAPPQNQRVYEDSRAEDDRREKHFV